MPRLDYMRSSAEKRLERKRIFWVSSVSNLKVISFPKCLAIPTKQQHFQYYVAANKRNLPCNILVLPKTETEQWTNVRSRSCSPGYWCTINSGRMCMVQQESHIYEGQKTHTDRGTCTVNNGIGKAFKCLISTLRRIIVLIIESNLTIINKYCPKDTIFTIFDLRLITTTYQSSNLSPCTDVILQYIEKLHICLHCWESTSFILSKYCPMFGFQSHLLPVLFRIHEWIIFCQRLIILPSLFDILFGCHRYIELFACKDVRITHNYYTI